MTEQEQKGTPKPAPEPFQGLATDIEDMLSGVHLDDAAALAAPVVKPQSVPPPQPAVPDQRVLEHQERANIRVLMLTYDDVLSEGSAAQHEARARGALFEELHIIVFTNAAHSFESLRIADNVFAYPTNTTSWWRYPLDAYRIAKQQLFFAGTFRADIVVADDPFELGLTAWGIATRFKRALHLTVPVDPDSSAFLDEDPSNQYRLLFSRFVVGRASRVRALTPLIAHTIESRHPHLEGMIDVIPRFIDVAAYASSKPVINLHDRHPGIQFIMVLYGTMDGSQNALFALDACQHALRQYGSVGLVVIGEGPDVPLLRARAKEKGVESKVFFEDSRLDRASCLGTADVLLSLSPTPDEETLIAAAASGVPVITVSSAISNALFVHEQSGIVCAPGDLGCVIKGINAYMGDGAKRSLYASEAKEHIVRTMGDARHYHEQIRDTIERGLRTYLESVIPEEDADEPEAEVIEETTIQTSPKT